MPHDDQPLQFEARCAQVGEQLSDASRLERERESLTLTRVELAQALGISTRTLDRLDQAGTGPRRVKGIRAIRYYREEVVRWLRVQSGLLPSISSRSDRERRSA